MTALDEARRPRPRDRVGAARALAAAIGLIAVGATPALGHEEAVLKSDQTSVSAGASMPLSGSDFAADTSYRLRLIGALSEYDLLDEVLANDEGVFSTPVQIPPVARPGAYQIVAVAPDGDIVARLDVTALSAAGGDMQGMESAGEESHGAGAARADEIVIQRDRSGLEWGVIGLVIGLAGGLGAGLILRRSTRTLP